MVREALVAGAAVGVRVAVASAVSEQLTRWQIGAVAVHQMVCVDAVIPARGALPRAAGRRRRGGLAREA